MHLQLTVNPTGHLLLESMFGGVFSVPVNNPLLRKSGICVRRASVCVYGVANPFDWMELILLQGKTNFFEKRVGDYEKASVMSSFNGGCTFDNH
ncbi:BnaA09g16580D [Brassica napus]|uniref:BnaA09g16580D protein n=1 Tax=Brassica napus TaxID=3708 RepID=A0A078H2V6_BRANA|nr:BnaA09g16580D [Brassica napus]